MKWNDDALAMMNKAPFFIRGFAKRKVEKAAKANGLDRITREFVEQIKSKEMPGQ